MPFTNPIKCKVVGGTLAILNSFVIAIFLVTNLRFGDAAAQLDELNIMGLIWPGGSRGQVSAELPKQVGHSYYDGQQRQKNAYNDLI